MNILNMILVHWNSYGTGHVWFCYFPLFFFIMFLLICFLFRGWRRRSYCWGRPWWGDYYRRDELDASSVLKKRYANGEISKEEYDNMLKDIS
jgi:uncharacterized membrane protein